MKVLVAGSRTFIDHAYAARALDECYAKSGNAWTVVVTGGARGADMLGEYWAKNNKLQVVTMKPDWNKHGRAAGVLRNSDLVAAADCAVVFWDGQSRGTQDTINKLKSSGKPFEVFSLVV
jgi:hypothetical protein